MSLPTSASSLADSSQSTRVTRQADPLSAPMPNSALKSVPCVQIRSDNLFVWWQSLLDCVKCCHLVAIDLELSGLGDRQKLNAKNIDDRYEAIQAAAKTRSVVSIGFSFFKFCDIDSEDKNNGQVETVSDANTFTEAIAHTEETTDDQSDDQSTSPFKDMNRFAALDTQLAESVDQCVRPDCNAIETKEWSIEAKLFNMLCLCEEEYICEPETMRFLAGHGFDFNGQCLHGLAYNRGNDIEGQDQTKPTLRNLVNEIVGRKLPIVLHNGFIDLIFFYQNFYAELPNDLQTFIADLAELFPSGIYDTKYIADFHDRLNRSYLEYLFYERQRCNIERAIRAQVSITLAFPVDSISSDDIEYKDLSTNILHDNNLLIDICYDYANHGWCRQNHSCPLSHNIDLILDKKKNKNKKLKKIIKNMKKNSENASGDQSSSADQKRTAPKQGAHRAGYDAFMTGYCLAFYMAVNAKSKPNATRPLNPKAMGISHVINNIYLTGKDQSLRITASSFAKPSAYHKNKISRIRCNK